MDGREQLLDELVEAPMELRKYLGEAATKLLANVRFLDALPGYVLGDSISQRRIPIILERLKEMGKI